jgi:hypothetical protein
MDVLQCEQYIGLLHEFAADAIESEGDFQQISAEDIPEPYRSLLVHKHDMTSTLERHWGEPMTLRVLASRFDHDHYSRQVVLLSANSQQPVEFGVIRIVLSLLGERAQRDVLSGKVPLGGILNGYGLIYRSCPGGFFRIQSNHRIETALGLAAPAVLYGRCNSLSDIDGRTIAEVVEILPPVFDEEH